MAFYKRDGEELQIAPTFVIGPGLDLRAETQASNVYPIEGWYWFDTLDAAMSGLPKLVSAGMTITPLQAKLALLNAGLLDSVETLIAKSSRVTKISWSDAVTFKRSSPLLNSMAVSLGMTSTQLDDLFLAAAQIEV